MQLNLFITLAACLAAVALAHPAARAGADDRVHRNVLLPPSEGNPRNSEGDFIQLADGRLMFVYTHFTGGKGDHASAHLAGRFSTDAGRTWTDRDVLVVPNEGDMNVMSVSLLRLADGRITLFYLRKNSTTDCRPVVRFSSDEAATWSEPIDVITDEVGYYVLNNDRVIQLASGRLIVPVALHMRGGKFHSDGRAMTCYSDDGGRTWKRSNVLGLPANVGRKSGLQEPGVVALKDGRVMMFARTATGVQYVSYSTDGGATWSKPEPSEIRSPLSPASIERIPTTGDLLLVWNDNHEPKVGMAGRRTPYNVAISTDEGKTWTGRRTLEADPDGWYCYTAIEFVGDRVVLGHCAGNRPAGTGLSVTQITSFAIDWLYEPAPEATAE